MTKCHDQCQRKIPDELAPVHSRITNVLSWKGYICLGSLLFIVFFWMIPVWLNHELSTLQYSTVRPIAETLFMRRSHWIQSAGIALGSICIFLAVRNYLSTRSVSKSGGSNIRFFSRLFAKLID
jgi:hypothetical protein